MRDLRLFLRLPTDAAEDISKAESTSGSTGAPKGAPKSQTKALNQNPTGGPSPSNQGSLAANTPKSPGSAGEGGKSTGSPSSGSGGGASRRVPCQFGGGSACKAAGGSGGETHSPDGKSITAHQKYLAQGGSVASAQEEGKKLDEEEAKQKDEKGASEKPSEPSDDKTASESQEPERNTDSSIGTAGSSSAGIEPRGGALQYPPYIATTKQDAEAGQYYYDMSRAAKEPDNVKDQRDINAIRKEIAERARLLELNSREIKDAKSKLSGYSGAIKDSKRKKNPVELSAEAKRDIDDLKAAIDKHEEKRRELRLLQADDRLKVRNKVNEISERRLQDRELKVQLRDSTPKEVKRQKKAEEKAKAAAERKEKKDAENKAKQEKSAKEKQAAKEAKAKAKEAAKFRQPSTSDELMALQAHKTQASTLESNVRSHLNDPNLAPDRKAEIQDLADRLSKIKNQSHVPNADDKKFLASANKLAGKQRNVYVAPKQPKQPKQKVTPSTPQQQNELDAHKKGVKDLSDAIGSHISSNPNMDATRKAELSKLKKELDDHHSSITHVPESADRKLLSDAKKLAGQERKVYVAPKQSATPAPPSSAVEQASFDAHKAKAKQHLDTLKGHLARKDLDDATKQRIQAAHARIKDLSDSPNMPTMDERREMRDLMTSLGEHGKPLKAETDKKATSAGNKGPSLASVFKQNVAAGRLDATPGSASQALSGNLAYAAGAVGSAGRMLAGKDKDKKAESSTQSNQGKATPPAVAPPGQSTPPAAPPPATPPTAAPPTGQPSATASQLSSTTANTADTEVATAAGKVKKSLGNVSVFLRIST